MKELRMAPECRGWFKCSAVAGNDLASCYKCKALLGY